MDQSIPSNQIFQCGPIQGRIGNIELPGNRMAEWIPKGFGDKFVKDDRVKGKEYRVLLQRFAKLD
jgi:hypothetical protein